MHRQTWKTLVFACIILSLLFVMLYSGFQVLESTVFHNQNDMGVTHSKTIVRNGKHYFPRQDIHVLMIMGIDETGPVVSSGTHRNNGECDVVSLLIFNETTKTYRILVLNRDTMVTMPALGLGGRPAGNFYGQLALSHTYGSGLEDSCENTISTVSAFLYGLQIDQYMALNMDAIEILTDAVGGVPVHVTEDFSAIDPTIPMGDTVLNGRQAMTFIRTRQGLGDQLNLSRMERHKTYMQGFWSALSQKSDDVGLLNDAYSQVSPYMVTNCSLSLLSALTSRYADYALEEVVSLPGENVKGPQFYEFHPDEEALDALILRLFYAEKR